MTQLPETLWRPFESIGPEASGPGSQACVPIQRAVQPGPAESTVLLLCLESLTYWY